MRNELVQNAGDRDRTGNRHPMSFTYIPQLLHSNVYKNQLSSYCIRLQEEVVCLPVSWD